MSSGADPTAPASFPRLLRSHRPQQALPRDILLPTDPGPSPGPYHSELRRCAAAARCRCPTPRPLPDLNCRRRRRAPNVRSLPRAHFTGSVFVASGALIGPELLEGGPTFQILLSIGSMLSLCQWACGASDWTWVLAGRLPRTLGDVPEGPQAVRVEEGSGRPRGKLGPWGGRGLAASPGAGPVGRARPCRFPRERAGPVALLLTFSPSHTEFLFNAESCGLGIMNAVPVSLCNRLLRGICFNVP